MVAFNWCAAYVTVHMSKHVQVMTVPSPFHLSHISAADSSGAQSAALAGYKRKAGVHMWNISGYNNLQSASMMEPGAVTSIMSHIDICLCGTTLGLYNKLRIQTPDDSGLFLKSFSCLCLQMSAEA